MDTHKKERRIILQILWGPLSFKKAIISPGQRLRVGRGSTAELSIPHDEHMAEAHFELAWDGRRCQFRDLGSASGTQLDGRAARSTDVSDGSWIRAGMTDFSVFFEITSPRLPDKPESENTARLRSQALKILRKQENSLFAVLDAARDARILELLKKSVEEYRSLYEGPQGHALSEVAPYLVKFQKKSRLLEAIVMEGWGRGWGIFLTCDLPFLETRRHLRKLLLIKSNIYKNEIYFRFYDPMVLRDFFSEEHTKKVDHTTHLTCKPHESKFIHEDDNGEPASLTLPLPLAKHNTQPDLVDEKFKPLKIARINRFKSRTMTRIRKLSSKFAKMENDDLLRFIQRSTQQAKNYGFTTERDIAKFIGIIAFIGEKADQNQAHPAWEILANRRIDNATKLCLTYSQVESLNKHTKI